MTRVDRIQIQYLLTFKTPFHFGTGIRLGLIDRTVVRDSNDYLYVPGSTFKGVVRERCEQLARLYEKADTQEHELIASPHDEKMALYELGQRISMITRIFGSRNHSGLLFFDDAHQLDQQQYDSYDNDPGEARGKYKSLQTDLYTQVRLNRPTRISIPGALYTSEFGVKELSFDGSISGWLECTPIKDNGPTYSLLLLLAGVLMIDRLGGNKSTGKGQCVCTITSLTIGEQTYLDEQWHAWLDHLDMLADYAEYAVLQEEEA
jgi:CRISPR/Cas system CMR subunit Cmr4 (Cas7 group RAMP superfamily)